MRKSLDGWGKTELQRYIEEDLWLWLAVLSGTSSGLFAFISDFGKLTSILIGVLITVFIFFFVADKPFSKGSIEDSEEEH